MPTHTYIHIFTRTLRPTHAAKACDYQQMYIYTYVCVCVTFIRINSVSLLNNRTLEVELTNQQ